MARCSSAPGDGEIGESPGDFEAACASERRTSTLSSGKVLRVTRAGKGLADESLLDGRCGRQTRSKVWAYGLRNPFRLAVRSGLGHCPMSVTWAGITIEEIDVAARASNLGWPCYEGRRPATRYYRDTGLLRRALPVEDACGRSRSSCCPHTAREWLRDRRRLPWGRRVPLRRLRTGEWLRSLRRRRRRSTWCAGSHRAARDRHGRRPPRSASAPTAMSTTSRSPAPSTAPCRER